MSRPVEIFKGNAETLKLTLYQIDGTPLALTGSEVYFYVYREVGQTPKVTKENVTPTDVVLSDPGAGMIEVSLSATDTDQEPAGYRFIVKVDGVEVDCSLIKRAGRVVSGGLNILNPGEDFTWSSLRLRLHREFGGGVLDVELTEDQFDDCIESSLREYNQRLPRRMDVAISAPVSGQRVDLTEHGIARGLVDVVPEITQTAFPSVESSILGFTVIAGGGGGLRPGHYDELTSWLRTAAKVYDSDFDWKFIHPYLYCDNVPAGTSRLYYTYAEDNILGTVPTPDRSWVIRYAVAYGKSILGRIRSKFQGVNFGPGGGLSMDGDTLRQEAAQEMEALREELRFRVGDELPFVYG